MSDAKTKVTLVLAGAFAGKTVNLQGNQFVKGKLTLHGTTAELSGIMRYLQRCYQAYPEGAEELEGVTVDETNETSSDIQSESGSSGEESSEEATTDNKTNDNSETGSEELPSEGSGEGEPDSKLIESIKKLDPTNNDHWTKIGLPAMEAVEAFYGSPDIKRADVEAAIPGYDREAAFAAAQTEE